MPKPKLPEMDEWPEQEILAGEKECLGFYLTSHPLKKHRATLARYATPGWRALAARGGGQEVVIGGMIAQVRARPDKKGNMMAFLTLEDLDGPFDAVVFSRTYEVVKARIALDTIVLLKGTIDTTRDQPSLIVNEAIPIEEADREFAAEVRIALAPGAVEDATLERLAAALAERRGACPVTLEVRARSGLIARVRVGRDLFVSPGGDLVRAVEAVLGPGTCRIRGAQDAAAPAEEPELAVAS